MLMEPLFDPRFVNFSETNVQRILASLDDVLRPTERATIERDHHNRQGLVVMDYVFGCGVLKNLYRHYTYLFLNALHAVGRMYQQEYYQNRLDVLSEKWVTHLPTTIVLAWCRQELQDVAVGRPPMEVDVTQRELKPLLKQFQLDKDQRRMVNSRLGRLLPTYLQSGTYQDPGYVPRVSGRSSCAINGLYAIDITL